MSGYFQSHSLKSSAEMRDPLGKIYWPKNTRVRLAQEHLFY
jgi:hypothetical protein